MSHISIQHCVVRSRIQNFTYVNTHDCSQSRDYKHKYLLLFLFLVRAGIQSALWQSKYVDGHRVLLKYDKKILYIFQQNCSMKPKVRKRVTGDDNCVLYRTTLRTVFGTVTILWGSQHAVRIPAGARHFSLLQNVQTGSGAHPASHSMNTWFISE